MRIENPLQTIGDLDVGASGVIGVTLQVAGVVPNGTLLSNGAVIADGGTAFASTVETTTVSSAPVFNLTIADAPDPISPADTLTYTITYANSGTDTAVGASIVATYDPGTTFVSAVPPPTVGNNQWDLGNLLVGGSGTIVVTLQVSGGIGTILTGQVVISDTHCRVPPEATASPVRIACLRTGPAEARVVRNRSRAECGFRPTNGDVVDRVTSSGLAKNLCDAGDG